MHPSQVYMLTSFDKCIQVLVQLGYRFFQLPPEVYSCSLQSFPPLFVSRQFLIVSFADLESHMNEMLWHVIFVSGFLLSIPCFQYSSTLFYVTMVSSFFILSDISLFGYTTLCFSIHLLMDIWIVNSIRPLFQIPKIRIVGSYDKCVFMRNRPFVFPYELEKQHVNVETLTGILLYPYINLEAITFLPKLSLPTYECGIVCLSTYLSLL